MSVPLPPPMPVLPDAILSSIKTTQERTITITVPLNKKRGRHTRRGSDLDTDQFIDFLKSPLKGGK